MEHTVLVTGATSGFGEASARRFLAHGHKVLALGRRVERLEALKASLPADQVKKLFTMVIISKVVVSLFHQTIQRRNKT